LAAYVWAKACRLTNKTAPAQTVGDELDTLQTEHGGRLTPRTVVDAARNEASALHPCFEWDDVRAAELHREHQARHVLASIRVVHPRSDPREAPRVLRAFVSLVEQVGDERQRAYVPMARVVEDSELLAQAIEQAAAELRAFEDRYSEFDQIVKAVRRARTAIEGAVSAA
jgi:hypothetical protein